MTTALLVNAYSVRNRGDAAIVEGLIGTVRRAGADRVIVCPRDASADRAAWLSMGADATSPSLLSIHDVPAWARPRPLLAIRSLLVIAWSALAARIPIPAPAAFRAYRKADIIIAVGGGYLGGPKVGVNLVKAFNVGAGKLAGRPVVVAPMTIAPPSRLVGWILRRGLRGTDVFVRDEPSAAVLDRLGVPNRFAPDLVFRAASALEAGDACRAGGAAESARGVLGWSPRAYRSDHLAYAAAARIETACVEAVAAWLTAAPDRRLRCIPQVSVAGDDDRVAIDRLLDRLPDGLRARAEIAEPALDAAAAVRGFAGTEVLLASRMHAALLASLAGVPALAVGYDPKVEGVMRWLGLGDRVIPADGSWSADRIAAHLEALREPAARERTVIALDAAEAAFASFDAAISAGLRGRPSTPASEAA